MPARSSRGPQHRTRMRVDETLFTRRLRFEWASDEGRPLVVSYGIALALALIWLLLVAFMPATERAISLMPTEEPAPVEITFDDPEPEPAPAVAPSPTARPAATPDPNAAAAAAERRRQQELAAIAGAFGGPPQQGRGGMVGDVSNVLRGVDVNAPSAGAGAGEPQGKAVIAYGQGGQGSRTPGRDGLGAGSGAASAIGGVSGGGDGVARATVSVAAPSLVRAETVGAPARDVGELGNYVRGRQSQIRFCYEEYGLKVNPSLAGTVTVAITIAAGGNVTEARVANRSWSGPGADETEACVRSRVSSWRFPASDQGGGTYSFPFNFTR